MEGNGIIKFKLIKTVQNLSGIIFMLWEATGEVKTPQYKDLIKDPTAGISWATTLLITDLILLLSSYPPLPVHVS